jgi:HK97 family phage prohead protease
VIEIRDAGRDAWAASGWATTWSSSPDRGAYFVHDPREGTFLERMERGAFSDAVTGRDRVELRREHDPHSPVFADTAAGTLRFEDLSDGLMLAGALSKRDPATQTAVADVRAGRLTGLSVGMHVRQDHWGTAADGRTSLRTISDAGLSEVSFVVRAANPEAAILSVRHETRSADGIEYRHVPLTVDLAGRQWANQHGRECESCGGSGECPDCDGQGWTSSDGDDGRSGGTTKSAGRSLATNGTAELEHELWRQLLS